MNRLDAKCTKNFSEFEVGAAGHGHATVAKRSATSLKKDPSLSRAGLDSSQPMGVSMSQLDKINPRPKSVLGLVRVGGREEELDPFSASQVNSYRVTFQQNQRSDALLFTPSCKLEIQSDSIFLQKGHDWVARMEKMIQMRPANVKLKDNVAQSRATRRIFSRAEFGASLQTHTRPPTTEALRTKPEPPAQHLMRSNGLSLSDIPDGESSSVDPMRYVRPNPNDFSLVTQIHSSLKPFPKRSASPRASHQHNP